MMSDRDIQRNLKITEYAEALQWALNHKKLLAKHEPELLKFVELLEEEFYDKYDAKGDATPMASISTKSHLEDTYEYRRPRI